MLFFLFQIHADHNYNFTLLVVHSSYVQVIMHYIKYCIFKILHSTNNTLKIRSDQIILRTVFVGTELWWAGVGKLNEVRGDPHWRLWQDVCCIAGIQVSHWAWQITQVCRWTDTVRVSLFVPTKSVTNHIVYVIWQQHIYNGVGR